MALQVMGINLAPLLTVGGFSGILVGEPSASPPPAAHPVLLLLPSSCLSPLPLLLSCCLSRLAASALPRVYALLFPPSSASSRLLPLPPLSRVSFYPLPLSPRAPSLPPLSSLHRRGSPPSPALIL